MHDCQTSGRQDAELVHDRETQDPSTREEGFERPECSHQTFPAKLWVEEAPSRQRRPVGLIAYAGRMLLPSARAFDWAIASLSILSISRASSAM